MKHLVILTGAGISAESGLATFRDKNGLWNNFDAKELASIQGYMMNRERVLEFYNARRKNLLTVEPNHAHKVLVELEQHFKVSIITQNVDNLHERAGSSNILHLHGELTKVTSTMSPNDKQCIKELPLDVPIKIGDKAADGSQLRPFIVLFGEGVPNMRKAMMIAEEADIFVIIGTSLVVYPAAYLTQYITRSVPSFIVDPGDFGHENLRNFEHIKMSAVAGIDVLREKLLALA